jgi:hypothetical protein
MPLHGLTSYVTSDRKQQRLPMIERDFAETFAAEWIGAWNSHELDRVLLHYADDFQFSSPLIPAVAGESSGILTGHAAVRAYWSKALARRADLHFELIAVFVGVTSIVIYYSRHDGRLGAEHFEFDQDGKVARASAHYAERL